MRCKSLCLYSNTIYLITTLNCSCILTLHFVFANNAPDTLINNTNTVEEVNHAICKIVTDKMEATANATITRNLKGICTSKEFNKRLDQLEKRLLYEISIIKQALNINNVYPNEHNYNLSKYDSNTADYDYTIQEIQTKSSYYPQKVMLRSLTDHISNDTNKVKTDPVKPKDTSKTSATETIIPSASKHLHISYQRDFEIAKYNVTIQSTDSGKEFLYFWKIYDIEEAHSYKDIHLNSPTFYISGHPVQIRFHPQHQQTDYVVLKLISNDNIVFKHRFTIINQKDMQRDLTSQILGGHASHFRVSSKKVFNKEFVINGSLTIKVAIFIRNY